MAYKQDRADAFFYILVLELDLEPLASRRLFDDIAFVYKLINGKLSCSELLSEIKFKIPTFNSRNNHPFLVPQCLINITKNSSEYCLLDAYNNLLKFDFVFDLHLKLKNSIINN